MIGAQLITFGQCKDSLGKVDPLDLTTLRFAGIAADVLISVNLFWTSRVIVRVCPHVHWSESPKVGVRMNFSEGDCLLVDNFVGLISKRGP